MRIERLDLTRFGMFTDVVLELLPVGVNVIVGANEAGKTSKETQERDVVALMRAQGTHNDGTNE